MCTLLPTQYFKRWLMCSACMCARACVHAGACACACTHTHTHTQTHKHTRTQESWKQTVEKMQAAELKVFIKKRVRHVVWRVHAYRVATAHTYTHIHTRRRTARLFPRMSGGCWQSRRRPKRRRKEPPKTLRPTRCFLLSCCVCAEADAWGVNLTVKRDMPTRAMLRRTVCT